MTADVPAAVAATFIELIDDDAFNEADELVHPDGPLDGTGDLAVFVSLV